jgi:hypothetical protein
MLIFSGILICGVFFVSNVSISIIVGRQLLAVSIKRIVFSILPFCIILWHKILLKFNLKYYGVMDYKIGSFFLLH